MAIDLTKVPLLSHIQYLYGDIRDRIKEKYSKPEEGIPASDLAPGVIPDIGLIENEKAPIIMETASGNPIVITDGAAGLPLSECKLTLLPRQSGSGDASPDNVRPMIPWGEVGTWTGGKNLYPIAIGEDVFINNGSATHSNNDGALVIVTNASSSSSGVYLNNSSEIYKLFSAIPTPFTVSFDIVASASGTVRTIACGVSNTETVGTTKIRVVRTVTEKTLVNFNIYGVNNGATLTVTNLQIESGSSATPYASYIPVTPHSVDLTGITPPVYGCELHLTTGEVWGTHVLWTKNTASMNNTADYPGWTNAGIRDIVGIGKNELVHTVLNIGDVLAVNTNSVNDIVYLPKTMYSLTQDEWITLAIDVQIALPLATPVLLATLTPQEIETLLGTNTIWSDADSIDIEYRADTELFINQNGVKDVQLNGASVTTDGVANIPKANANTFGVAKVSNGAYGLSMRDTGDVQVESSTEVLIKNAQEARRPIVPYRQHISTFYGLAKAAGADMAQSSNAIGTYTDAAKQAIQKMLGLDGLVGPYEADITADRAYAIGETFVMDGKRYKATAAIAQGGIITPGTNCELDPLTGDFVKAADYKALPAVAAADNGKILQVVNGEWAAASIPNANGVSF